MTTRLVIRRERAGDAAGIRAVNLGAFESPAEADVVDRIRQAGGVQLSLVAEIGTELVGHILFSEVTVGDRGPASGMGLAPMAVLPERQNRGIGTALVARGLKILRADGHAFVIVLGHRTYYPRFGFVPASRHGIESEYDGLPDGTFMILELAPGGLDGVSGIARYRSELGVEP